MIVRRDQEEGKIAPPVDNTENAPKRASPGQVENRSPAQMIAAIRQDLDLALQHHNAGRLPEAENIYRRILQADAQQPVAWHLLGVIAHQVGKVDSAVDHIAKALAISPDYVEAHNSLGNALKDLGRADAALASYRTALVLAPDRAELHCNLGTALAEIGDLDAAIASFRHAVALKPDFAEAHRHLAGIKKHTDHDGDIQAMELAFARPELPDGQRMHLAFGLGKAFENLRQYDAAFSFFAEGNRIRKNTRRTSVDLHGNFFAKLAEVCGSSLFARHPAAGCQDETPIFVVGMLRSGTTLVEQILASHPEVHGAGELDSLSRVISATVGSTNSADIPEWIRCAESVQLEPAGLNYIAAIRSRASDSRFITDKMPGNFKHIGLIKLMLPHAKVIHCRRDPADTCLSIFKTYFTQQHDHVHDLVDLGRYYRFYAELMAHWHSVLPGFVHEVEYEKMVADPAGETRALVEFCGLEWDDACLAFHQTVRQVATASAGQVRRPLYKDSVRLWKRYETQLAPLLESLRAGDQDRPQS